MIRVLQVVYTLDRGGIETLLMNIFRKIDRSEILFDFLVHADHPEDHPHFEYEDEVRDLGGRIYRAPRYLHHPVEYRRYVARLISEHPEYRVVHGHNLGPESMDYMSRVKKSGAYLIAHGHNTFELPDKPLKRARNRTIRKVSCLYPDHFFGCSEEAARYCFGERIAASSQCEVFHNGIDLSVFEVTEEQHRNLKDRLFPGVEGPVLCTVGRLAPQKNQSFAIAVLSKLLEREPGAVLVIIGEGPLRKQLSDKARALGITDHVLFTGSIPNVPEYLKASDVFLFPSVFEGLGIAAIEAQACGLPTLMSDKVPGLSRCSTLGARIPLEDGASTWAARALAAWQRNGGMRHDRTEDVRAAGFDINAVVKHLSDFYLIRHEAQCNVSR
jgi:glycosyltransferase involved in cell wall biosynthesis